ncbi:UxaA family hydrolase [uncultured Ilyobacter sp.]|uniref:UxaA family hydrolase n=1 Tax=uncultured Ilyobacter sp. TaxID=544433 RepID=UPI0029F47557|nr:UxaA family hydrolase [uncultured Ilyobacter sp.]
MLNAVIIDDQDDVVVAIEEIKKGSEIKYTKKNGDISTIIALDDITIYHKAAAKDISEGKPVVKYGEHIGVAKISIETGMHVHEHNVEGVREEL